MENIEGTTMSLKRIADDGSNANTGEDVKRVRISDHESGPSPVLHIRNLPPDANEADVAELLAPFGGIVRAVILQGKHMGFVQLHSVDAATMARAHFETQGAYIRGRQVYFSFSKHQEVKPPPDRDPGQPSHVLLVTIHNVRYNITVDTIYQVFSKFGTLVKSIVFTNKAGFLQALVQFTDVQSATNAKNAVDGQNIYTGCCTLHVAYSNLTDLNIRGNGERSRDWTNPNLPTLGPSTDNGTLAAGGSLMGGQMPVQQQAAMGAFGGMHMQQQQQQQQPAQMGGFGGAPQVANPYMAGGMPGGMPGGPGAMGGFQMPGMGAMGMPQQVAGQPGSVLIVGGFEPGVTDPHQLFTLFGCYGDVQRVKILYNKPDTALIQFDNPYQAELAMQFLNGIPFRGRNLRVSISKHASISVNRNEGSDNASAHLTRDYAGSPLHRFRSNTKAAQHVSPPAPTLHLYGVTEGMTEETIRDLFATHGNVVGVQFFMNNKNMALVQMATLDEAVSALVGLHNTLLQEPNHYLKVSFTKSTLRPKPGQQQQMQQQMGQM